jgi:hypothetical protein
LFTYIDPENVDGEGTIASIDFVYDGKRRPAAFALVVTTDRAG